MKFIAQQQCITMLGGSQMLTLVKGIKFYNAKEVHPAKDCEVLVLTGGQYTDGLESIISVSYHDGYFNGKEYSLNDKVYAWAYATEFESVFKGFKEKEEDDF